MSSLTCFWSISLDKSDIYQFIKIISHTVLQLLYDRNKVLLYNYKFRCFLYLEFSNCTKYLRPALSFLFSPVSCCLCNTETASGFLDSIRTIHFFTLRYTSRLCRTARVSSVLPQPPSPSTVTSLHLWPYLAVATGNSAHLFNLFTSCIPRVSPLLPRNSTGALHEQLLCNGAFIFSYLFSCVGVCPAALFYFTNPLLFSFRVPASTLQICAISVFLVSLHSSPLAPLLLYVTQASFRLFPPTSPMSIYQLLRFSLADLLLLPSPWLLYTTHLISISAALFISRATPVL